MSALIKLLASVALVANVHTVHEVNKANGISFDIPKAWKTQDQSKQYPPYSFFAGYVANPEKYALQATPGPWLVVSVETVGAGQAPPVGQAWATVPAYLVETYQNDGLAVSNKTIVKPHVVHQGGLSGSAAVVEVVIASTSLSTAVDTVSYVKGNTMWMVASGCSIECFDHNAKTIEATVNSVKVGTAIIGW